MFVTTKNPICTQLCGMKKIVTLLAIAAIASCAKQTAPTASSPSPTSEKPAETVLSSAEIERAQGVMKKHCGSCHKQHDPMNYSVQQWSGIVPKMVNKVNGKAGSEVITPQEKDLLLAFRKANAGR